MSHDPDLPAPGRSPATGDDPCLERLWPSVGTVATCLVLGLMGAAVGLPFGPVPTLVGAAAVLAPAGYVLARLSTRIGVTGAEFVAGPAHIPLAAVGEVTPLDAAAMRRARGPELDARAFLCLRGWVGPGLRVVVDDPQDPTPYWLVSTRNPGRLVAAVERARAARA